MLAEALRAGVDAYIAAFAAERGRRLVVRNGYHQPREVLTAAAAVEVSVPRVNDERTGQQRGERKRFCSAILPPWARKTPKINEVAAAAVPAWPGERGLRAGARPVPGLGGRAVPAGDDRSACGRPQGAHRLARWVPRVRESWLTCCATAPAAACAPVLAVRDGALGFWRALREVLPKTREGRCWFHKSANVLAALPKSAHPGRRRPWRRSGTPRAAIHLRRGEGVCGRLQGQVPQKTC